MAKIPADVPLVTGKAPGCRLHRCASTDDGLRAVTVGAAQVVDQHRLSCPTDTLQVEVAVAAAHVYYIVVLGRQRVNDDVVVPVI